MPISIQAMDWSNIQAEPRLYKTVPQLSHIMDLDVGATVKIIRQLDNDNYTIVTGVVEELWANPEPFQQTVIIQPTDIFSTAQERLSHIDPIVECYAYNLLEIIFPNSDD